MLKKNAWVILRLDGEAHDLADYVAIKGVYDTEPEAIEALRNARSVHPESRYELVRSRRISNAATEDGTVAKPLRVQGFDLEPPGHTPPAFETLLASLRALLQRQPRDQRGSQVLSMLGVVAELLVAESLGGFLADTHSSTWDVELPDGRKIEVKVALLQEGMERSPVVNYRHSKAWDTLAVVVFRPDLTIERASMIPAGVAESSSLPAHHGTRENLRRLRITSDLLRNPQIESIPI